MKIAIFPGHFLPHTGGLETHVDELSKYLSKNHEITIFTPNTEKAKEKEIIHNNVKVLRYPAFFIIPNFPFPKFWKRKFWSLLKEIKKPSIVMTRTRFFLNSFIGLLYSKIKRKPLIHVEHGSDYVILNSKLTTFIARVYDETIGRLIFKSANEVIAISGAVKKFCEKFTKKQIPIITRGVDFEIYHSKKDSEVEKRFKNKKKVLFLGRLYKWKGVANGIEAFKKLPKNKDLVYLIVGDGEDKERLKNIADDNIVFLGRVSFERAINILNSTDIYLHSAYPGGGLSNSLLQAMYTKCLVVASPHEGAKEVVNQETGILLKNNSVEELKKGLKTALKIKNKKLQLQAHNFIKKEFSWHTKAKQYEEVFEKYNKNI